MVDGAMVAAAGTASDAAGTVSDAAGTVSDAPATASATSAEGRGRGVMRQEKRHCAENGGSIESVTYQTL